ncbi:DUF934 domain-containing protein [Citromicrobium bathyomarinum]|uniref:DUF934 domain-containing protein n=1 Tax=Citromicrobium bathyomarinum TaxID=72174 RepID=UPI001E3E4569|nr:DUF934 domain-containing protein [Citromicrobium bathyomarinum]MCD1623771.1 DUF934 domain-containing protein [Citromicrobium bathyomarinum]
MPEAATIRLRDDTPCMEPAVTLEAFAEQTNAVAVRIEPGGDARELLAHLDRLARVDIAFPAFTDGRGYSAARILREAGFAGELRAVGDVLVDQLAYMRRCGFDAFAPDEPIDIADAEAAFARFPEVYQSAADPRTPIWALRHGGGDAR